MGTRGVWGFRVDGNAKQTYNHYDSYPEVLGRTVMQYIKDNPDEVLRATAKRIKLVDGGKRTTPEEQARYGKYADTGVSTGDLQEWYVLLRGTQGEPQLYTDDPELDVMIRCRTMDDVGAEYKYIINVNTKELEISTYGDVERGALTFDDIRALAMDVLLTRMVAICQ